METSWVAESVAADEEEVFPAAIFDVHKAGAPADEGPADGPDPRRRRPIAEEMLLQRHAGLPVVVVQGMLVVLEVGHEQVGHTRAVIVACVHPHAAVRMTAVVAGGPALQGPL